MQDSNYPHDLSPADGTPEGSPDLVAQAEALFENYLAARLQHATREVQAARLSLARDSGNPLRRRHVREAERTVEILRRQLAEQAHRTEHARQRTAIESRAARNEPETVAADAPESVMPSPTATAEFRNAQAERAEQIAATGPQGNSRQPFISKEEIHALRAPTGAATGAR